MNLHTWYIQHLSLCCTLCIHLLLSIMAHTWTDIMIIINMLILFHCIAESCNVRSFLMSSYFLIITCCIHILSKLYKEHFTNNCKTNLSTIFEVELNFCSSHFHVWKRAHLLPCCAPKFIINEVKIAASRFCKGAYACGLWREAQIVGKAAT